MAGLENTPQNFSVEVYQKTRYRNDTNVKILITNRGKTYRYGKKCQENVKFAS